MRDTYGEAAATTGAGKRVCFRLSVTENHGSTTIKPPKNGKLESLWDQHRHRVGLAAGGVECDLVGHPTLYDAGSVHSKVCTLANS